MADDDEIMEPDDLDESEDAELDVDEIDAEELDDELEDDELDDEFEEMGDDDIDSIDDDEDDDQPRTGAARRAATSEEDDEDEDLLAPDDVEADLDTILKDRLVAAEEEGNEDDEEPEDRTETATDRLQPKRADEVMCQRCFLLVREGATFCPVDDDDCPTVRTA